MISNQWVITVSQLKPKWDCVKVPWDYISKLHSELGLCQMKIARRRAIKVSCRAFRWLVSLATGIDARFGGMIRSQHLVGIWMLLSVFWKESCWPVLVCMHIWDEKTGRWRVVMRKISPPWWCIKVSNPNLRLDVKRGRLVTVLLFSSKPRPNRARGQISVRKSKSGGPYSKRKKMRSRKT